jgi:hypothetical protein
MSMVTKVARALIPAAMLMAGAGLPVVVATPALAQEEESGLRKWEDVSKGFERVTSTTEGTSLYGLWQRKRDGALLAELPRGWENQRHFVALTVPTGELFAGLQAGELYVYWRRVDNRLMLIEPQIAVRSTGDRESRQGIQDIFTDRVILDVPILCMGPSGQPVIDMRDLLTTRARDFYGATGGNPRLAVLKKAKAFPQNIEVAYEMPTGGGRLQTFHYSISLIPDNTGYKPREADERVGYFTTVFRDLGKFADDQKWVRYINRWQLEKRDPNLRMSPPKEPIIFYIEHTTPVRYRKFVRDGILRWNQAFARIGIIDAIEVRQQDAETGAYMDLDPEDVRYNFIRWLTNDIATAVGPSRVHPLTGQILDADVVLTDGWIRAYWFEFNNLLPDLAVEGMHPETLQWLEQRPQWDPRLRLLDPMRRQIEMARRARRGVMAYGGHPIGLADPDVRRMQGDTALVGESEYDGMTGRVSQRMGLCMMARGKAFDMAMIRMSLDMYTAEELESMAPQPAGGPGSPGAPANDDKPKFDTIDGVPEWFVGPALVELTAHEVGHCLGLRHNFKASSVFTLDQINSDEVRGKKPWSSSVMDYNPTNLIVRDGKLAGDTNPIDIGPYDYWAIEYGYTSGDHREVLKRVADPMLVYQTDEDTIGPDPLARRWDMSSNTIDYANSQMELARYHRGRLLDKFVREGQSWARVRRGYVMTLGLQTRSLSMVAGWVGGANITRDRKGDPNGRDPVTVINPAQQRAALKWIIDNAFFDEAFGLTPELLSKMTVDKWLDDGGFAEGMQEPTFPIHDRIGAIQSSALTMVMNPTTLRRVYDNEYRLPPNQDTVTLPEVLTTVSDSIWRETAEGPSQRFTARQPMISSLRRNLQSEHLERLIDLTMPSGSLSGEAGKAISNLAVAELRRINTRLNRILGENGNDRLDPYSAAHLAEARTRITKALDASYIYNASSMGGGFPGMFMFGQEALAPRGTDLPSREPEQQR